MVLFLWRTLTNVKPCNICDFTFHTFSFSACFLWDLCHTAIWYKSQQVFNFFYFNNLLPIYICIYIYMCVCIYSKCIFISSTYFWNACKILSLSISLMWTTMLPPSLCYKNNTVINTIEPDSLNVSISTALCKKWKWYVKLIYIFSFIRVPIVLKITAVIYHFINSAWGFSLPQILDCLDIIKFPNLFQLE